MLARSGLLAALLVLVALPLWLWREGVSADVAVPEASARTAAHGEAGHPALPGTQEAAAPAHRSPVGPQAPQASIDPVPSTAPRLSSVRIAGTVTVVDVRGRELAPSEGRLHLQGVQRIPGAPHAATELGEGWTTVRDGAWGLELELDPELHFLRIASLTAGDARLVVLSPQDGIPWPLQGPVAIRAQRADAVVLRVLDASTGQDLDGVHVVRPQGYDDHPGPASPSLPGLREARSPLTIPSSVCAQFEGQVQSVLVGVEGYAWARVGIDFATGGERVVALQPGCTLEVRVRGAAPAHGMLRFRGVESSFFLELPLEGDATTSVRGLPEGSLRVDAELGEVFASVVGLGRDFVTLEPHRTAIADLELAPAPEARLATVRGRVLVPQDWKAKDARIAIALLDAALPGAADGQALTAPARSDAAEGFDGFDWSFEGVQAGRHELAVVEPPYSFVIEVPPGATQGLELRVPPPVDLRVRLVDAHGGEELRGLELSWTPLCPDDLNGRSYLQATYDPITRLHGIRAPIGLIDLHVWNSVYTLVESELDTSAGGPLRTVRLERACGMDLCLRDGETYVRWDAWAEPEPVDGSTGVPRSWGGGPAAFSRLTMSEPGTYAVLPPKIAGYRQPPLQRIVVRAGEFTQVVVQLERER